jgi:hypothetical protein
MAKTSETPMPLGWKGKQNGVSGSITRVCDFAERNLPVQPHDSRSTQEIGKIAQVGSS